MFNRLRRKRSSQLKKLGDNPSRPQVRRSLRRLGPMGDLLGKLADVFSGGKRGRRRTMRGAPSQSDVLEAAGLIEHSGYKVAAGGAITEPPVPPGVPAVPSVRSVPDAGRRGSEDFGLEVMVDTRRP